MICFPLACIRVYHRIERRLRSSDSLRGGGPVAQDGQGARHRSHGRRHRRLRVAHGGLPAVPARGPARRRHLRFLPLRCSARFSFVSFRLLRAPQARFDRLWCFLTSSRTPSFAASLPCSALARLRSSLRIGTPPDSSSRRLRASTVL